MNKTSSDDENEKSLLDRIKQTALVISVVIGVISGALVIIQGADAYIRSHRKPTIEIVNHLALPIIIEVNDSSAYKYRVEAKSQITITLLSEADFPAKIKWNVIRNKNVSGKVVGEALSGEYSKIDKGREIDIENVLGTDIYFYPVITNNSDDKCLIVINDGLTTEYTIGASSPHKITNITGYFKYAKNSNVTLYCNNKPYWHGIRNGESSGKMLPIQSKTGITEIAFP